MKLNFVDYFFWVQEYVVHIAIILVLLFRKNLRGMVFFKVTMVWELIAACGAFAFRNSRHAYFLWYWIGGYFDYALQFGIVVAVAREVLTPVRWWLRESRKGLLIWTSLGLLVGVSVSLGVSHPAVKGFDLWEKRGNILLLFIMCGILVATISISNFFHLYRRKHILAIGVGMFIILYSVLLTDFSDFILAGTRADSIVTYCAMFLHMAVYCYWIVLFWKPENEPPPLSAEMKAQMIALYERMQHDVSELNGPRQ